MKELFLMLCFASLGSGEPIQVQLVEQWPNGFKMNVSHNMTQTVTGGWKMTLKFSKPIGELQFPNAKQVTSSYENKVICLRNLNSNANFNAGEILEIEFTGVKATYNEAAPSATLELRPGNDAECDLSPRPTIYPPGTTPPVQETSKAVLIEEWPNGFKMKISILLQQKVEGGWEMTITFPTSVEALQTPDALQKSTSEDRKECILENEQHNAFLPKCSRLAMIVTGRKADNLEPPAEADIEFRRKEHRMGEDQGECI